jgi:hypothetical protein
MSFDTNNTWVYKISGRNIHLYQYLYSATTDVLAGYSIRIPDAYFGDQLVYPDESITGGLRFEGTAFIEPFVNYDPNELTVGNANPTLTDQSSPDEDDHVNLSRMLCLAVVDYLRSRVAEANGNLDLKEYYMKEFWKKVGDNHSNKIQTGMSYTSTTYAVK